MVAAPSKVVRCAIYTRVSTDAGLDQEFNSLDAQFDAAQAYIRSQAHAGWTMVRSRYDDGGFSGGSTDRPALQQLLADIRDGKVNVIVVYKVDRLTRSLADFAKLVELFDSHGVSFVSVTQQFNTTTSMGRLTLNVLLSFAQFEREVTSERIRDKIGASKRKGLWVGGVVPLGYRAKDRQITVAEDEAKTVRDIFQRYLELGSLNALLSDLRATAIRTKIRPLSSGRSIGGIPFTRGSLAYLLRNRFYIGDVRYKGEIFKGEQTPILDPALFEAVQSKLEAQRTNHTIARHSSEATLMGLIFDGRGNRMTPTYAIKKGVRYRYYVSSNLNQGDKARAAALNRVPAIEIETLVIAAVKKTIGTKSEIGIEQVETRSADNELIRVYVTRIVVETNEIVVTLRNRPFDAAQIDGKQKRGSQNKIGKNAVTICIPWRKRPTKLAREIIRPVDPENPDRRPIRSETRAVLVKAIANGRRWLEELITGRVISADQIASREKCSVRQVNRIITLAFLAPDLVQAAVDGRLPRGIGVEALRDCPLEWRQQRQMLGLA